LIATGSAIIPFSELIDIFTGDGARYCRLVFGNSQAIKEIKSLY
jgi:hypothetical protein